MEIPMAMSVLVFCQNFGGAVMVVFAQTILTNSLRQTIPKYAPRHSSWCLDEKSRAQK